MTDTQFDIAVIGGGPGGRAQSAKEIRERLGNVARRASDRIQQGSTLLRGPAGRAGRVFDLRLDHMGHRIQAGLAGPRARRE